MSMKHLIAAALMLAGAAAGAAAADTRVADRARQGDTAGVRALVATQADVNAPEADGMTALHWAAQTRRRWRWATHWSAAGANPNAGTRYGITPLALAATNGSARFVELLLKAHADANAASPEGETPHHDRRARRADRADQAAGGERRQLSTPARNGSSRPR